MIAKIYADNVANTAVGDCASSKHFNETRLSALTFPSGVNEDNVCS
jgi:hypothetical protein